MSHTRKGRPIALLNSPARAGGEIGPASRSTGPKHPGWREEIVSRAVKRGLHQVAAGGEMGR